MNHALKNSRLLLLCFCLFVGAINAAPAAEGVKWSISLDQARERANAENKTILVDFTGSKWCPACIQMNKEVIETQKFKDYASRNLIFVEADFASPAYEPTSDQDPVIKYRIEAFPTYLFLDKSGHEITRLVGYYVGGPDAFIAKLNSIKK